ncbi:ATP-binding protein [Lentzea sp. BCCO 10_0856]|uniref:ATP-binding protein n=1 Tax=Lentzea miocenica TaxID=3095431 RepID=A0ABU4ST13_9PSEU|nr:ATP-binding protein [Lentzea sp. BCCO 10_0856]MDX8029036.1 ATP-binding protein [Lentzea sp. BCCO 10_0856]
MDAVMTVPVHAGEIVSTKVPRMHEVPRFIDTLELVALPTAMPVARMFIFDTLKRWHALFIEGYMAAVAVELVTLSVEQTGEAEVSNPITLRMLGYQRHIVFEVTDVHGEPLALPSDAGVPEGHGLGLVDTLANRWGSFIVPQGRVNWAELAVCGRAEAGLPHASDAVWGSIGRAASRIRSATSGLWATGHPCSSGHTSTTP